MVGASVSIIQNEDVSSISILMPKANVAVYNMQNVIAAGAGEYQLQLERKRREEEEKDLSYSESRYRHSLVKNGIVPDTECANHQIKAEKALYNFLHSSRQFSGVTIGRVRSKIRKLLLKNMTKRSVFATLTFENEPASWKEALPIVQKWLRNMGEKTGGKAKVLYVPEMGEKGGRLHVHAVITGEFQRKAAIAKSCWKEGICDTEAITKGNFFTKCSKVAHYICKYISKSFCFHEGRTRAYYITQNWGKSYIRAYMNSAQAKKVNDAFKALKKVTVGSKMAFKTFSIGEVPVMSFNYTFPSSEVETCMQILKKKGIAYFEDTFTGVSKNKERLREFGKVLMQFASRSFDKKLLFVDYDNLKKCLPSGLSDAQKQAFCECYRSIQRKNIVVLDPVKYSSLEECEYFLQHPAESAMELNAAFILRQKTHKLRLEK